MIILRGRLTVGQLVLVQPIGVRIPAPQQMKEIKKYLLWLIPSGDAYDRLSVLISRLSEKYSSPQFEPHVSLLGVVRGYEEEIIAKAADLARIIKPYEIKLSTIDYLDEYFRCFFIRAQKTEDVMKANLMAKEVFGLLQHDGEYTPHLSLLYGNFPSEIKEKIIAEIGKELDVTFEVRSIDLFLTEGEDVNKWHRVKKFDLH